MGLSAAQQLAAKGANLILVARGEANLRSAVESLKPLALNPESQRFTYIAADLTKSSETERMVSEAQAWNHGEPLDIVWCIAGYAIPKLFLDATPDEIVSQTQINYFAAAFTAHAVLKSWVGTPTSPGYLASKDASVRHLVFTSTTAVFASVAGYSPYSPAKAAMRTLCDTLNQEILLYTPPHGIPKVKVHMVFPGTIDTPGLAQETLTKPLITRELEKPDPISTPEEVARQAIKGLERGQYFVVTNLLGQIMRSQSWGVSEKNSWVWDTMMQWVVGAVLWFIWSDMVGKTAGWARKYGHPAEGSDKLEKEGKSA
jgi:3-dehydrosphinganine reductase